MTGAAAFLVCRSVGYNRALREPIEGDCILRPCPAHDVGRRNVLYVVSIAAFELVTEEVF